ncbi:MAG: tyrosine recombinase XerC [Acutalibacteraceae bacterium]|nr:tyrosine recombinase XerC [Acutalibacteraceae bacterium]
MSNPIDYNELPEMVREFLMYLGTVKNKSQNTIKEYYLDLRTFFRFIKLRRGLVSNDTEFSDISISDIDTELISSVTISEIYEFMNFTLTKRNNSAKTRARKTSSLKTFYKYHTYKSLKLKNDPTQNLEAPKVKKSLPKYLTLEEALELLNAVEGKYKERDYCIITLFLNCGLRLSELTSLNINSFKGKKQMIVTGKGNKERIIYLNNACISALNEYKKVRPVNGVKDREALFLSRQNNRISPKTVQAMVNKYLCKIGLDGAGYSVHKLRHTAATLMYQHGNVDIRVLQDILGHENLGTTEIYTHLSDTQMENAVNSNPLSKVKNAK